MAIAHDPEHSTRRHARVPAQRWCTTLEAPFGPLTLVADDSAVVGVSWEGDSPRNPEVRVVDGAAAHPMLLRAARELEEYFDGTRRHFDVPVDLSGTAFQRQAWKVLCGIPYGATISYGEQARRLGNPNAVRAVGGANGRNPVGIIVPCHRVIGADGSLTGFGGGLHVKQWLLDHERRIVAG